MANGQQILKVGQQNEVGNEAGLGDQVAVLIEICWHSGDGLVLKY